MRASACQRVHHAPQHPFQGWSHSQLKHWLMVTHSVYYSSGGSWGNARGNVWCNSRGNIRLNGRGDGRRDSRGSGWCEIAAVLFNGNLKMRIVWRGTLSHGVMPLFNYCNQWMVRDDLTSENIRNIFRTAAYLDLNMLKTYNSYVYDLSIHNSSFSATPYGDIYRDWLTNSMPRWMNFFNKNET